MKNYLMFALILCAIPAVAVGQTGSCDDCTHAVSVYMGEGGLIASTDADMVSYVASCNGVTRHGELTPNEDGVVAMLLAGDFACYGEGGSFELGPIMDGGWYWLTMETNSAVGGLVSRDILDNDTVDVTDAGEGVTMTAGKGAVLLTESATGRVGILPNILPEPPAPDAVICGPRQSRSWPYAWTNQMSSGCMLGGGRTKIRLVGPGAHGATAMITSGMVYRPAGGTVTVTADLWVDESGSYSTDDSDSGNPSAASIQMGWAGKTASATGGGTQTNWLNATFDGAVGQTVGAPTPLSTAAAAGVTLTEAGGSSTPTGQATFTIAPQTDYCSSRNNHTATLTIWAIPASGSTIHPPIATGEDAGLGRSSTVATWAATTQLRIVCPPASSANKGQDLVPENPFPVDE